MNKIICRLTPVTQTSITAIDGDGNQLENVLCTMEEFSKILFSLADKYDAKEEILFSGPISYTNGVLNILKKETPVNYNLDDYKIKLL